MTTMNQTMMTELKREVLIVLTDHIGEGNAISMTNLHRAILGEFEGERITATRNIREAITQLRLEGRKIVSSNHGYFLANSAGEMGMMLKRWKQTIRLKARMISSMQKIALPQLMGQLTLEFQIPEDTDGTEGKS